MIYTGVWPVTTDGSDCAGRITLPYLCSLLQETATMHADELGWGLRHLEAEGLQWVLSRQWLRMERYPRWHDTVTVDTWPSAKTGLTWRRDYRVKDIQGRVLGEAASLWLVMDRQTRRPRPAAVGRDFSVEGAERVRDATLKPLAEVPDLAEGGRIRVGFHDIDIHGHINNVRYLRWMIDRMEEGFLVNHQVRELEINFLAEGMMGDELEVQTSPPGATTDHALIRRSEGAVLSRMRNRWGERLN